MAWVPGSRSKFGNWTSVPSQYIAEVSLKVTLNHKTTTNNSCYIKYQINLHFSYKLDCTGIYIVLMLLDLFVKPTSDIQLFLFPIDELWCVTSLYKSFNHRPSSARVTEWSTAPSRGGKVVNSYLAGYTYLHLVKFVWYSVPQSSAKPIWHQVWHSPEVIGRGDCRVDKLLAPGARGRDSNTVLATSISKTSYLLLQMIWLQDY